MRNTMCSAMRMSTPASKRERLGRVVMVAGGLCLALVAYSLIVMLTGHGIPCPVHRLSGLSCPGCGMSRALAALFRLDFAAAFSYNPLWPLYLAYVLYVFLSAAVPYVRHGSFRLDPRPAWISWAMLGAILVFGVWRNLPFMS